MDRKLILSSFVVGIALFSMFFGGGNLTWPLWMGIQTSSLVPTTLGFVLSAVFIPFYGTATGLYFEGNYERYLGVFGKSVCLILIFALLLFWIPLGSGPRCNQLAYGAFVQMGWSAPLWVYSAGYSIVTFLLTYRKSRILDLLGNFITPLLLVSLGALIYLGFSNVEFSPPAVGAMNWAEFWPAFESGYLTMDFIATVFFTTALIALIKEKGGTPSFQRKLVVNACMIAIGLLSVVYLGMITVGCLNADLMKTISRDQLLAALGRAMFHENYHFLIFTVITLSCLTTSIALALVFADYLRKTIFREKLSYEVCVGIAVLASFLLSLVGFESLSLLISYAMSTLYPFLIFTVTAGLVAHFWPKALERFRPKGVGAL